MLDGNALAAGKAFFQIGTWAVSPNGRMIAYAEDIVGRRQYTLRVKDLVTGATLADNVANIEPNLVWANDNRTLLYVEKDPVTLLSVRVRKHVRFRFPGIRWCMRSSITVITCASPRASRISTYSSCSEALCKANGATLTLGIPATIQDRDSARS